MAPKVLVTGIAGFVGNYLAEYLLKQGCEVTGWMRSDSISKPVDAVAQNCSISSFDMTDRDLVTGHLDELKPEFIFHLAAKSHIGRSWEDPQDTLVTNMTCQINLFESLRKLNLKPVTVVAGSSEEYGIVRGGSEPVDEHTSLNPVSPYAVSKVAQDLMGLQYFNNYGLPIIRTRSFNQSGPRRSEQFVTSAFCRQVALIESGRQEPVVKTGNLDAVRDFIDVRDAVRALWLCAEKCSPGEVYNICGGEGRPIRYILDVLAGLSSAPFEIQYDPDKARPSDLPVLIGDPKKFKDQTGWEPEITFEQSLEDLLNDWRNRVKESE